MFWEYCPGTDNHYRNPALTALGISIVGFSYGIIQPFVYDKTASLSNHRQASLSLALVMSMNYMAIVLFPFLMDIIDFTFHTGSSARLPFGIFVLLSLMICLFCFYQRDSEVLSAEGLG